MLFVARPHHTDLWNAQHVYTALAQATYHGTRDVLIGIEPDIVHAALFQLGREGVRRL